jgi:tetratricopeptide (TPR) repeat protein
LARFNAGDEVGALSILDDLRAARDRARQRRNNFESAADGRSNATLALDARGRGKVTTALLIARFEDITRLDPGVHRDWAELARLYRFAGRLRDALDAARTAASTAGDDRDRSVAFNEVGDVLAAQGDRLGALASYREAHAIAERLAQADPGDADGRSDLAAVHQRIGDILLAQGGQSGALASCKVWCGLSKRKGYRSGGIRVCRAAGAGQKRFSERSMGVWVRRAKPCVSWRSDSSSSGKAAESDRCSHRRAPDV